MDETRTLQGDVRMLGEILGDTLREQAGAQSLALVAELREAAISLRDGRLPGGRDAFAKRVSELDLDEIELVARAFTQLLHLMNTAEEQHRIRTLRERDRPGAPPDGSIAAACVALRDLRPDDVRELLGRLFVMPVLTAHPTEARRRTLLYHLTEVSNALDRLDDPRPGAGERERIAGALREAVGSLLATEETRAARPTPTDEVKAGLHIFERSLLEVTPALYRELEDGLAACWPGERFDVGPFLRWGTWIGGDRDGNPTVTAEATRSAIERQRALALAAHLADADALGWELSMSVRRVTTAPDAQLRASLAHDRTRLPAIAAQALRNPDEPWREKMWYVRARLEAARTRGEGGYADAQEYLEDLRAVERSIIAAGLARLARGRLRDSIRRAEVFGFHLASMDLRQHSAVHEAAVGELLARGGVDHYARMPESARVDLLSRLLERADVVAPRDRAALSPQTRDLLATLDVVGRARRELSPQACERYVISFTSSLSDLLEVLFLARAAKLAPDELRPIPLLEQLEDIERAQPLAEVMLDCAPVRTALGGELEVMLGYSDSGKQAGYVAAAVALRHAQESLARVARAEGVTLTIFHGRGGTIGRGGGPANRTVRAQPAEALRGRLRVTEQGETVTARYGRPEIARRDMEQLIHAVLLGSIDGRSRAPVDPERHRMAERAAHASRVAYDGLLADRARLVAYATAATPIEEVMELPIASRPASRSPGLSLDDLRAIPWVFSWNQSRHGVPGWFGLGSALDALVSTDGLDRVRALYAEWPFFRALVDNAQLALARADMDVAEHYSRLADPDARSIFDLIRDEHARTVRRVLEVTGAPQILASWPTIAHTVERRNPFVDVISHAQIELLRRLRAAPELHRERIREVLFTTINGIAAGLQTAG